MSQAQEDLKTLVPIGMAVSVALMTAPIASTVPVSPMVGIALLVGALSVGHAAFKQVAEMATDRGEQLWEDLAQTPVGQRLKGMMGRIAELGIFGVGYAGLVDTNRQLNLDFSSTPSIAIGATVAGAAAVMAASAAVRAIRLTHKRLAQDEVGEPVPVGTRPTAAPSPRRPR